MLCLKGHFLSYQVISIEQEISSNVHNEDQATESTLLQFKKRALQLRENEGK